MGKFTKSVMIKKKPTLKGKVDAVKRALTKMRKAVELKHIKGNLTTDGLYVQATRTWQFYQLSNISQNNSSNGRIGLEITPTSLYLDILLRGCLDGAVPHSVRIIVFQDLGFVGNNFITSQQLLDNTSTINLSTTDFCSSLNRDFVKSKADPDNRIKILMDRKVLVSPSTFIAPVGTQGLQGGPNNMIHIRKTLRGLSKIHYVGAGATISDVGSGAVFLAIHHGTSTGSSNNAFFSAFSKITFKDE